MNIMVLALLAAACAALAIWLWLQSSKLQDQIKALTDKATSEDHKKHLIIGFEAYMEADAPEEPKEAGFVAPQLDESKLLGEPAPAAPKTP